MNLAILEQHLIELSHVYPLNVADNYDFFILRGFELPPGYNRAETDVWLDLPDDYPESPPGVGSSRVFLPSDLQFGGRKPADYHERIGPKGWAWWCYESISWDPCRDNLLVFFELLRTHMTDPP